MSSVVVPLFAQVAEVPDAASAPELPLAPPPENFDDAMHTIISSVLEIWRDFLARIPLLLAGLFVILATWALAKFITMLVRKSLRRTRLRSSLRALTRQFTYMTVWVVGLLITAVIVFPGMTPSKVLTFFGLGSIAIGFAFKDIVENFFAGVLILWRFPFETGDFIECDGLAGEVEDTTIRMTLLRQLDGQLVVVPNAQLLKSPVNVLTSRPRRRVLITTGVAYGEDVDQSRQVIQGAVESCDTVDRDQPVQVFAREFADSSVNFEVAWWTGSTPLDERRSRDQVVTAIKRGLDEAGIEIPFPYRTLTFKEPVKITKVDHSSAS